MKLTMIAAALCGAVVMAGVAVFAQEAKPAPAPIALQTGWTLLKEGEVEGNIEVNAAHPTNAAPNLLRINETKTPDIGKGRVGAKNSTTIKVEEGKFYDVTFNAATQQGSIGLVFSLETADGKVLARTTLPEIGRGGGRGRGGGAPGGRGGRGATGPATTTAPATEPATGPATATAPATTRAAAAAWPKYLVSLHARGSAEAATLTITPIESTTIWLENVTVTPRAEQK